ncbi:MAG: nucleotidyltransferase domain-containing protein [Candidatus Aminicenantes bacterium]|nr:nucleotidyltransferase domain-containing protein [Candidatus Aminicenantes bacterium]
MNKTVDFQKITALLKKFDCIVFALIFGSTATGKIHRLSDVDIGIYAKNEIPLLELGKITSELEKIVGKKVDLLLLNNLYKEKPGFAFRVISSAKLLFTKDEDSFVNFKTNVFLYYLDAKPLIDMVDKALHRRIETGAFGERNYA